MDTVGKVARRALLGLGILVGLGALPVAFPARGGPQSPGEDSPILDTRGIEIIQKIPIGKSEVFDDKALIDFMVKHFTEKELRTIEYNLIPAELILSSISSLVIKQMGLEKYAKVNEVGIVSAKGAFGEKLWEILSIDPENEGG